MKLTLPAQLPVTFYPDLLDDTRKEKPTLQLIKDIPDQKRGTIRAYLAINGNSIELHDASGAKAILKLDDILAGINRATFHLIDPQPFEANRR